MHPDLDPLRFKYAEGVQHIHRIVKHKELPVYTIGRVKRFRRSDIEAYLARVRSEGPADTTQQE